MKTSFQKKETLRQKRLKMISKAQANTAAYLQQISSQNKKESISVDKTKEMDKVESLKEQIQKGDYKLDTTKTAQAIAKDLI